jgi:FKBP-type peptidyl-prolyl cis-trans isomerase
MKHATLLIFFLGATLGCRTHSRSSPAPEETPLHVPKAPDRKEGETPNAAPSDSPPILTSDPIPLPPPTAIDPKPLPPSTTDDPDTNVPAPKFFYLPVDANRPEALQLLVRYGGCHSHPENTLNNLTEAEKSKYREGECSDSLTVTAPTNDAFKRIGTCWISKEGNLSSSIALYDHFFEQVDGKDVLRNRDFQDAMIECSRVSGAFRGEENGLIVRDEVVGTGEKMAVPITRMEIAYEAKIAGGAFIGGSSADKPLAIAMGAGQLIRGFEEGLQGMRRGGRRKLSIPPELAYGETGQAGVIPPNATLEYKVELTDFLYPVTESISFTNLAEPQKSGKNWTSTLKVAKASAALKDARVLCTFEALAGFRLPFGNVVSIVSERVWLTLNRNELSAEVNLVWDPSGRVADEMAQVKFEKVLNASCESSMRT